MTSIRRQLFVSLLSAVMVGGLGAALGIYVTVEDEFSELFDYELTQVALSFRDDSLGSPVAPPVQIVDEEDDLVIQIWNRTGTLVYLSDVLTVLPPRAQPGFSSVSTPGTEWRAFSTQLREHTIQVAQPMSVWVRENWFIRFVTGAPPSSFGNAGSEASPTFRRSAAYIALRSITDRQSSTHFVRATSPS